MSFRMRAVRLRGLPSRLLNGCLEAVFPEVRRPGHKADLPMPMVRKVQLYLPSPICLHGVHREAFTFTVFRYYCYY
jgi:hypothetical protein